MRILKPDICVRALRVIFNFLKKSSTVEQVISYNKLNSYSIFLHSVLCIIILRFTQKEHFLIKFLYYTLYVYLFSYLFSIFFFFSDPFEAILLTSSINNRFNLYLFGKTDLFDCNISYHLRCVRFFPVV